MYLVLVLTRIEYAIDEDIARHHAIVVLVHLTEQIGQTRLLVVHVLEELQEEHTIVSISFYIDRVAVLTRLRQSSQLKLRARSTSFRYIRCSCSRRWRSHESIQTSRHLVHSSLARGERNSSSGPVELQIAKHTEISREP